MTSVNRVNVLVVVALLFPMLASASFSLAQGLSPGGLRVVNQLYQVSQGDASMPGWITIQGPRIWAMTMSAATRIPSSQLPAVINTLNRLGALPASVAHELAVEYYLIVEILLDYYGVPQNAQAFIDGIWTVSPGATRYAEEVLAFLRAIERLPAVPPGGGLFSTDPVLLCRNLNLGRALGGVPLQPCQ